MEKNQLNSGTLESLKKGETLLLQAKKVKGDKIQLQFAEIIQEKSRPLSALGVLNSDDARFSSRARRSFTTASPVVCSSIFNMNFGDDGEWVMTEKGEVMELNILNPEHDGTRFRVIVTETTEATDWQLKNIEKSAKRKGKEGDFITFEGEHIFSNTETIMHNGVTTDQHVWLKSDTYAITSIKEAEVVEEEYSLGALSSLES
jgi:hypothetical protein